MADLFAPDAIRPDIQAQIVCVDRELGFRTRVYRRWVEAGRMTQKKMDDEIATMEEVLATLRWVQRQMRAEPMIIREGGR